MRNPDSQLCRAFLGNYSILYIKKKKKHTGKNATNSIKAQRIIYKSSAPCADLQIQPAPELT